MKKIIGFSVIVVFLFPLFVGCAANTGIVKISDDTYLYAKQSTFGWAGSPIKVELYQEANEFCAKMGKKFVQTSHSSSDARMDRFAGAEIQFKCQ